MFCPACGTQLPESAKFCLECGAKLAAFAPGISPETGVNKTAPIGSAAAVSAGQGAPSTTVPSGGAALASTVPASQVSAAPAGSGTLHGAGGAAPSAVRPSKTGTTAHGAQVFVDPGDDAVVVPISGPSRKQMLMGGVAIALVSLSIGAVGAWRAFKASRPQTTTAPPLPEPESSVALLETPRSLPRQSDVAALRATNGRGRATTAGRATQGNSTENGAPSSADPPAGTGNTAATSAGNTAGSAGTTASAGSSGSNSGSTASAGTRPTATATGSTANNTASNTRPSTTGSGSSGSSSAAGNGNTATAGSSGAGASEGPGLAGPRAPAQAGYVEGEATDATGTLDPAAFTFVYRHFRTQISSCHSSVTRGGQAVAGIIRVRVRIGTDGHVVRTSIAENSTSNAALATCVQNQIRSWRYPAPEGGEVEMEYRLGFGN